MPFAISPSTGDRARLPRFFGSLRRRALAGARIHYEVHESHAGPGAPAVVLIQGLGLSSRFWFDLPDRLRPKWRVVLLDNRGVGRSDRPRGPYRMAAMADDVAAVLNAAGVQRACIVGISLGGMIAQHVALRHPARVAGLVLLATTAGFPHARLPPIDDALIPAYNSRMLARLVPNAHLEIVAGCGHAIPASDPDCVRRALARLAVLRC
jgi:pimeloyl-ACP methyl ester carboxylesterase